MIKATTPKPGSRFAGPVLVLVFALAFTVGLTTGTASAKLGDEAFYDQTLENVDAYDRLYDDVLFDPALTDKVANLLGGVEIPVDDVKPVVQAIVPIDVLKESIRLVVQRFTDYLKESGELLLAVDVTEYLQAIRNVVVNFVVEAVGLLPSQPASSYEEFVGGFQDVLLTLDSGAIPTTIPSFDIPAERVGDVAGVIDQIVGIDPSSADGQVVEQAIAQGQVAEAIKLVVGVILADTVSSSVDSLASGLERGSDGAYLLGPSGPKVDQIKNALAMVRRGVKISAVASVAAAILALGSLVALAVVYRRSRPSALRWAGAALLAGGALTFLGWLAARSVALGRVKDAAVANNAGFPASFSAIVRDAIDDVASQLTAGLWTPALVVGVLGLAAIAASLVLSRRAGGGAANSAT